MARMLKPVVKNNNGLWTASIRGKVVVTASTFEGLKERYRWWVALANQDKSLIPAAKRSPTLTADEFGAGTTGKRDCWVRAVANTTGFDYSDAEEWSNRYGYKGGIKAGMPVNGLLKMVSESHSMTLYATEYRNGKSRSHEYGIPVLPCMTVEKAVNFCKINGGKWIVGTTGHVFSVVDGKVMDNGSTTVRQRVDMLIKVEV